MKEHIRNVILDCLTPLFSQYVDNIDNNLRNDNKNGALTWIKQIENVLNFIDNKVKNNE